MKKLLFDENRALRRGIRLGLSLAALSLAAWLTPLALAGLFARLFEVWGVTADNVLRAPGWVRLLYEGWLYFSGLVQGGGSARERRRPCEQRDRLGQGGLVRADGASPLRAGGPALLFEAPVDGERRFAMPVLANLFGTPRRVALGTVKRTLPR